MKGAYYENKRHSSHSENSKVFRSSCVRNQGTKTQDQIQIRKEGGQVIHSRRRKGRIKSVPLQLFLNANDNQLVNKESQDNKNLYWFIRDFSQKFNVWINQRWAFLKKKKTHRSYVSHKKKWYNYECAFRQCNLWPSRTAIFFTNIKISGEADHKSEETEGISPGVYNKIDGKIS